MKAVRLRTITSERSTILIRAQLEQRQLLGPSGDLRHANVLDASVAIRASHPKNTSL